jgi:hypothetical protein
MSWKSNAGVVIENNVQEIPSSDKINFITAPMSNNTNQTFLPNTTVYVTVEFVPMQDITTENVEMLQETGGSFNFLKDKEEKTYKPTDGDPL